MGQVVAEFFGSELRLARNFNGLSLDEVGERVGKTRQHLHRCEIGIVVPTPELLSDLAAALRVSPEFFFRTQAAVPEELFHFRKLFTTKAMLKLMVMSRGEMFLRLSAEIEKLLRFPTVNIPEFSNAKSDVEIEAAAEECRYSWGLGLGPIDNMNRLAENIGVLVTSFHGVSTQVDALSLASARPVIVRNDAKESTCRQRFDVGHELGHLVLHVGVVTGDKPTESQANRFSSALLVPRAMMMKFFPRPKGSRLDWQGIRAFKETWKVSKAMILYRAWKLELLTEDQYKTGVITLRRTGEATGERDDHLIPREGPDLLQRSFAMLATRKGLFGDDVARMLAVDQFFLDDLVGFATPRRPAESRRHLAVVA